MAQTNIHRFFTSSKPDSAPVAKSDDTLRPPANSGSPPRPAYDQHTGQFWYYPRSDELRIYQFNIVKTALCFNTLVAIPTGLGKTFIASAVILNYVKWFPGGKIVFLAPTRPLVAQQITGVRRNANLSAQDVALATGEQSIPQRQAIYQRAKVWFMTPQALENDINRGLIDLDKVVLLVIDEAHRATGSYAYCNIINALEAKQVGYRLLALSATPASQIQNIQSVVDNLKVCKVEVRRESDPDIAQYTHEKAVEMVQVDSAAGFKAVEEQILRLLGKLIAPVCFCGVMDASITQKPQMINKMNVLDAINRLGSQRGLLLSRIGPENIDECYSSLGSIMAFLNGKVQLTQHGLASFLSFLTGYEDLTKDPGKKKATKRQVMALEEYKKLKSLTDVLTKEGQEHPKMYKLADILRDFTRDNEESTAIVFTQYRTSAYAIKDFLGIQLEVTIKSAVFIGQSRGTESLPGMAQKEQTQVIEQFRAGTIRVLIATSVGEEGLDIGQVDLIVCYDACSSPIRMIQRFGRTGRQRNGRVVVLVADGSEANKYASSMKRSENMVNYMKKGDVSLRFYSYNPRMIPEEVQSLGLKECCFAQVKEESSEDDLQTIPPTDEITIDPVSKRTHLEAFPGPPPDSKRHKSLQD